MSNATAERWWVKLAARWLARIDGVSGQLRLAMLALTGVSTASLTLQQYGYGHLAAPFILALATATLAYTYLYAEGGVWNQVSRDRRDMSNNFSAPPNLIRYQIQGRQFAVLAAQLDDDLDVDDVLDEMLTETRDEWAQLRDGVDLEAVETQHRNAPGD